MYFFNVPDIPGNVYSLIGDKTNSYVVHHKLKECIVEEYINCKLFVSCKEMFVIKLLREIPVPNK